MKRFLPVLAAALLLPTAAIAGSQGFGFGEHAKAVDTNGDGALQIAEVEAAAAKRAAAIDANGDGRIEVAEVRAHRETMRAKRAEMRLMRLDADGDGSVSVEEFGASRVEALAKRDADGDGVLSADELRPHRHGARRGPRHAPGE